MFSWSPLCDIKDSYPEKADQSKLTGSLDLQSFFYPSDALNMNAKVPGTSFNFKCSSGFGLSDGSNPDQQIACTASMKVVGLDTIDKCLGKVSKCKIYFLNECHKNGFVANFSLKGLVTFVFKPLGQLIVAK